LSTKGNAWVASFPTPNCSIRSIRDDQNNIHSENDLPNEEQEIAVDRSPSQFDFLGKGIDAGFRISKNSNINAVTVSPGLGLLLCKCLYQKENTKFDLNIKFNEVQEFKGVAGNSSYPVLYLESFRDQKYAELQKKQHDIIGHSSPHNQCGEIHDYLKLFLEYHHIEIPKLPTLHNTRLEGGEPDFYQDYISRWNDEFALSRKQDNIVEQTSDTTPSKSSTISQGITYNDLIQAITHAANMIK